MIITGKNFEEQFISKQQPPTPIIVNNKLQQGD